MTIRAKCSCGAEFEMWDEKRLRIRKDDQPDMHGDVYRAERLLREFREEHHSCVIGPIEVSPSFEVVP